jgi:hypothetical protein
VTEAHLQTFRTTNDENDGVSRQCSSTSLTALSAVHHRHCHKCIFATGRSWQRAGRPIFCKEYMSRTVTLGHAGRNQSPLGSRSTGASPCGFDRSTCEGEAAPSPLGGCSKADARHIRGSLTKFQAQLRHCSASDTKCRSSVTTSVFTILLISASIELVP